MKRSRLIRALAILVALAVAAGVWSRYFAGPMVRATIWGTKLGYSEADYKKTRERAEAIIAALARWKTSHGNLPVTLEELVPSELPRIEAPLVGKGVWEYGRRTDSYELGFFVGPMYESDTFDSAKGAWTVDR